MFKRFLPVALTLLTAALALSADGAPPASAADWDRAAAARYLDARMDAWWSQAKSLKTGDSETKCLSCHTAIPYALARPALRLAMGERAPTAHETRILDTVRRRVENVGKQQPFYDHTEDKKIESRGVEAVLNALILTTDERERGQTMPGALTRTAVARLWEVQRPDGAWDWLNFGLEPYETSDAVFHGATVAALVAGSPTGKAASAGATGAAGMDKLRIYLRANLATQRLFNRTWALLASSRLTDVMAPAERDAIVRELESKQRTGGGWSLVDLGPWRWSRLEAPFAPPGPTDATRLSAPDAYATALIVYALKQSGLGNRPAVEKGMAWLRTNQSAVVAGDPASAPWRAHSLNFEREQGGAKGEAWRRMFMSDLATAFAVLALL